MFSFNCYIIFILNGFLVVGDLFVTVMIFFMFRFDCMIRCIAHANHYSLFYGPFVGLVVCLFPSVLKLIVVRSRRHPSIEMARVVV